MASNVLQIKAVFYKNWKLLISNKRKIGADMAFPILLSAFYYLYANNSQSILAFLFKFILMFSLGLLNSSPIRSIVTLFITQRQESHREYQMIMGLSYKMYTFSNLSYQLFYYSIIQLPFFICINIYQGNFIVNFYTFFCYSLSGGVLAVLLTSLFKDHKVAVEIIGFIFSMSAFLPLVYETEQSQFKKFLFYLLPNPSFTLSILSKQISKKLLISTMSIMLVPVYIILYGLIQYREFCISAFKNTFRSNNVSNNGLLQEIELEQQSVFQKLNQDNSAQNNLGRSAISIDQVTKQFDDMIAVNQFSLQIVQSQILGLLGRNGAGKTTLVDMITKVTKPTTGKIVFTKNEIQNGRPKLGICYQKQILYEELTPTQHLIFFSMMKGLTNFSQQIQQLVQKVGFVEHVNKKVKELSGGNKRKLSVSLALLGHPKITIFDEPTSGLDPHSRRNIWNIIEKLKQQNITVILTTHHLDQADYLSDRICVIEKGKKLILDTPQSIKQKYGQGYYLTLQQQNEVLQGNLERKIEGFKNQISSHSSDFLMLQKQIDKVKYFISKNIPFKELCILVQNLQKQKNIRLTLQRNTLQQSFIAILSEYQEYSDINLINMPQRPLVQLSTIKQIWGIFLKNAYCFFRKYYAPYCLTLIVFLFILGIDIFILKKIQNQQAQKPNTNPSTNVQKSQQVDNSPMGSMIILQIYILMTSAFIGIPMDQKQKKITHLLRTRGLGKINYWLGHYLFDMLYFMICFIIMRIALSDILSGCPLILIISSGTGMILLAYCGTLLFQKKKTANLWFTLGNFLLYIMIMPFLSPIDFTKDTFYHNFKFITYIYPYFDIAQYLTRQDQKFKKIYQSLGDSSANFQYHIQYSILFLLTLLIVFEGNLFKRIFKRISDLQSESRILLQTVSKNYGQTQALKNVSYSINNQRVALLGHNGAGKSTTFQMLSSQLHPTSGDLYVQNKIKKTYQQTLESTGICYQDDTLWECLTCDDIFRIFSVILGLDDYEKQKKWLFQSLQFDYNKKKFEHLSGGNKRKLCLAIALMGQPDTRLLDQCSTGLDPVSRVAMVNTIKRQRCGSTIFTTHSIPEAQDLCTKAIIMKQGCVEQNDKIYKLKQKHYDCYWVYLTLEEGCDFQQKFQQIFSNWNQNYLTINCKNNIVQINKAACKLSQLMKFLYKYKQTDQIVDFKIDQPKLEDVYIKITGQDINHQQNSDQIQQRT